MRYILSVLLVLVVVSSHAQRRVANKAAGAERKDSLGVLICPLNGGYQPVQAKQAYEYDKPPLNIILTSNTDSVVRASIDGIVSKVQRGDEGYEIVFFHNNYWFWYSGISKTAVRANQKIKAGDALGYIEPGQQIELLIYDFETPIDPKKYLDCKK
jgi:murein DD-endopeptidase MepM/ murein hydrolase activator NlpD